VSRHPSQSRINPTAHPSHDGSREQPPLILSQSVAFEPSSAHAAALPLSKRRDFPWWETPLSYGIHMVAREDLPRRGLRSLDCHLRDGLTEFTIDWSSVYESQGFAIDRSVSQEVELLEFLADLRG
jgi:hypothetical protein